MCLVLSVILLAGLVSCAESREDVSALDQLTGDGDAPEEDDAATDYYRIVLSGKCSASVAASARMLEALVKEMTGIECGIVYDTDTPAKRDDVIEILIGGTSRNATAVALEGKRADDYVCCIVDGSVVVGGYSNSATEAALARFIEEVMPYATRERLMEESDGFSYTHEYAVKSVTLCGFDVCDFAVIYSKDGSYLDRASLIASAVAESCGGVMTVLGEKAETGRKEIIIREDDTSQGGIARIFAENEDVVLSASDAEGIAIAVDNFIELLLTSTPDGTAALLLDGVLEYKYSSDEESEKKVYYFIIPGGCSASLASAARTLADTVGERLAAETYVYFDSEDAPRRENVTEIFIGSVDTNAVKVAFESLRLDDYVCRAIDGAIVLGGYSDAASVAAIQRFCEELLPLASAEELVAEGGGFLYRHAYELDGITLGGFDVCDFTVVYPRSSSNGEKALAEAFAAYVAEKSGKVIEVLGTSAETGRKEIIFKLDASTPLATARIYALDEDVVITSDSAEGIALAYEKLIIALSESISEGKATLPLDVEISFQYKEITPPAAAEHYLLILPRTCSAELYSAARTLEDAIEQRTGIACHTAYDAELPTLEGRVIEIVLGNAAHSAARASLALLRADDYVCRHVGEAIFIGGVTDSATVAAIGRFERTILVNATNASLMSADAGFYYSAIYEINDIRLCGFAIYDYTVVASGATLAYAEHLVDGILQKSGYSLDIASGADASRREIVLVLGGGEDGAAHISSDGTDVLIRANDVQGISVGMSYLYGALLGRDVTSVSFDISSRITLPYSTASIRVMSVVSGISASESSLSAIVELSSRIRAQLPDVVLFGRVDKSVFDMLWYDLSADYECINVCEDEGVYMPVIYRKDAVGIGSSEWSSLGGVTALELMLTHKASAAQYRLALLACESALDADKLAGLVAAYASGDYMLVVSAPEGALGAPGVLDESIGVALNGKFALGATEYRVVMLTGGGALSENVTAGYNSASSAAIIDLLLKKDGVLL